MATWYNTDTQEEVDRLLQAWTDAPYDYAPELCASILGTAREQVIAFAPALPETVPDRYVLAQVMQAQNLWNAGRAQQEGGVGGEGYIFYPRPLDKTIRRIIRPQRGVPNVF